MARMTTSQTQAVSVVVGHLAGLPVDPPPEVVRALYVLATGTADRYPGGWNAHAVRSRWAAAFDDVQRAPSDPADPPLTPDAPINSA